MSLIYNFYLDVAKSKITPLLIELSKKDLDNLCNKDSCGINISLTVVKDIYDEKINKKSETNVIVIDGDRVEDNNHIYLLEILLELIKEYVNISKRLNTLKSTMSAGLSLVTGGVLNSVIGSYVSDTVVSGIKDISNEVIDNYIDIASEYLDIGEKFSEILESEIFEQIKNTSSNSLEEVQNKKLSLSDESKKALDSLSQYFKEDLTPAESFRLVLELMLSVAIKEPILLFIKNPHKLDKNSLAILSLLFSVTKDLKDEGKHTGLSVIYAYEDEKFQPYMEVEEKYKLSKKLLDDQRLYTQRYAMLERPTSDIPHIAVKSSMFVGRKSELLSLNNRYFYSKEHSRIATLETISGEPGVGKTKLIKKHLEEIRKREKNGIKQIQLTLLNQVGHTSTNTGLASLTDSIIKEAERLISVKSFSEKTLDKVVDYTYDFLADWIALKALRNIGEALVDQVTADAQIEKIEHSLARELDKKSQEKKLEQFNKLTEAIKELQSLSDDSMPVVLFVDDLQWIDEDSAEYLLTHFVKYVKNVHIVASIRASDSNSVLKQIYENREVNLHTIALLNKVGIELKEKIVNEINTETIEPKTTNLKGLDIVTLTELISHVIKPQNSDETRQKILAEAIIEQLGDENEKGTVTTLFAVEAINMLCDEKFYSSGNNQKIEKLIFPGAFIKFNLEIVNFTVALEKTFETLKGNYYRAFNHINQDEKEGGNKQKFNLMAYAVLEERLHILRTYFAEHGNAAVNTLLFSSLLGTPFNSAIVKNVLESLATTEEKLLQPIKKHILKDRQETSLRESHYEIIEEVYEILSRYKVFDNAYEYRHSLLNIFLTKQLEYFLFSIFGENEFDSYNKFYELILEELAKEEDIVNNPSDRQKLFFESARLNVLELAYNENYSIWAEELTSSYEKMSRLNMLLNDNQRAVFYTDKSIKILRREYYLNDTTKMLENYINSFGRRAYIYRMQNNFIKSLEYYFECKDKLEFYFLKSPIVWGTKYIMTLLNLSSTYYEQNDFNSALVYVEDALIKIKDLSEEGELYMYLLLKAKYNLAKVYTETERYLDAKNLLEENLLLVEVKIEESSIYLNYFKALKDEYINGFSILFQKTDDYEAALKIDKQVYLESYDQNLSNPRQYISSAINYASSLRSTNKPKEALEVEMNCIVIVEKLYNQDRETWIDLYSTQLNNAALSCFKLKRYSKALELYKKQYQTVDKSTYQSKTMNINKVEDNIARCESKLAERTSEEEKIEAFMDLYENSTIKSGKDLIYAILENDFETVKLLVEQDSNIILDYLDDMDSTDEVELKIPLVEAVKRSQYKVVEFLLINNAYPEVVGYIPEGTVLYFAIANNDLQMVELLLSYGADIYQETDSGESILDLAQKTASIILLNFIKDIYE